VSAQNVLRGDKFAIIEGRCGCQGAMPASFPREMGDTTRIRRILQEIRVKQYTKNVLVYAVPLFSGTLFAPDMLKRSTLAFVSFCLVASVVYILNDIMDREKDRQHPTKCHRPIASGKLPLSLAIGIFCALLLAAGVLSWLVRPGLMALLAGCFLMNIAYSVRLKHIVLIDVMIIAAGFVMRAFAGTIAIGVGALVRRLWLHAFDVPGACQETLGDGFAIGSSRSSAPRPAGLFAGTGQSAPHCRHRDSEELFVVRDPGGRCCRAFHAGHCALGCLWRKIISLAILLFVSLTYCLGYLQLLLGVSFAVPAVPIIAFVVSAYFIQLKLPTCQTLTMPRQ